MPLLFWDASALIKRYTREVGSDTVSQLFAAPPTARMVITYLGYAETAASLRRKFNQQNLTPPEFTTARFKLEAQVLENPDFDLLSVTDADILTGIALTDRHNLNSTDAAILAAFLHHVRTSGAPNAILIAADQRLLRAAALEGLRTLNPERVAAADVPTLLASS